MIDDQKSQVELFSFIKSRIPPGTSLVEQVSEALSISTDSAYRRIRGDKFLVLPELIRLCQEFNVPLNELVEASDNSMVSFHTFFIDVQSKSINTFLTSVKGEMERISSGQEPEMTFIINDLNLFQLLQVPELAAFKFFFWQKSGLGAEGLKSEKFSLDIISPETQEIVNDIIRIYLKMDSVELISDDVLAIAEKQIVYYYDMGFIPDRATAILLLEKLLEATDHLNHQAESGKKFAFGYSSDISNGAYDLYYNSLVSVDNLTLAKYNDEVISYNTNNYINLMKSSNRAYYDYNMGMVKNLIQRSELISQSGERARNKVFRKIKTRIQSTIDNLD